MIYVLDTDHLTVLERGGAAATVLQVRLMRVPPEDVATTIVTYDEQMRGWLAEVARANTLDRVVEAYSRLQRNLDLFRDASVLPFDGQAAKRFRELRNAGIRIGTMDLRIASIVLAAERIVLTRNTRDFLQVPGLRVENWCD